MERTCHPAEVYAALIPSELTEGRRGEKEQTTSTTCATRSSNSEHRYYESEHRANRNRNIAPGLLSERNGRNRNRFGGVCKLVVRLDM